MARNGRILCLLLTCFWFSSDGEPAQICPPINQFSNFIQDRKILGSTFLTLTGYGLVGCAKQCLLRSACRSFNYKLSTTTCQLNSDMDPSKEIAIKVEGTVSSFAINWPRRITEGCENITCPFGSVCEYNKNKSVHCRVECNDPSFIRNVQIVSVSSKQVGARLEFNCSRGFLKKGIAICLNNGTWSEFGCEKGCVKPPFVKNAVLLDGRRDWPVGTVLNYTCKSSYVRLGSVECTTNSTWTDMSCIPPVRSCADLLKCGSSYTDGEYWLVPKVFGDKPVKIYCDGMTSGRPRHFLTLPEENYVDYSQHCCRIKPSGHSDKNCVSTRFLKVIITDIKHMTMDLDGLKDKTFTNNSHHCHLIQFGSIFSCYVLPGCTHYHPRDFRVDTRNTGLAIHPRQEFFRHIAYKSKQEAMPAKQHDSGRIVEVVCHEEGGWCYPKKNTYTFVVDTEFNPVPSEATSPKCNDD